MVIQNSLTLLTELSELENKIKEVERYLSDRKIQIDDQFIFQIISEHLHS